MTRTIALDFDGVLHQYDGVYSAFLSEPIPGAREAIFEFLENGFEVVIFSTRDSESIETWLKEHNFPPLTVTDKKPLCVVMVDDRAIRFDGVWSPEFIASVACFRPYWGKRKY